MVCRSICSSSVTLRQFQFSLANSMVFRAALLYSSEPDVHIFCRTSWEYSDRSGIGLISTSLLMLTRRRDFFLPDDDVVRRERVLEWHRLRAPVGVPWVE